MFHIDIGLISARAKVLIVEIEMLRSKLVKSTNYIITVAKAELF